MQIVWFKRDLRVFDNEAFKKACEIGPVLPLYIFEKNLWKNSPMCMKHYTFLKQSLHDLNNDLAKLGQTLIIEKNNAIEVFKEYKEKYNIKTVWSHQETWNYWVMQRNNNLSEWFRSNNIRWIEVVQNGVIRNLKSREGWAKKWNSRMNKKVFGSVIQLKKTSDKMYKIPAHKELDLKNEKNTNFILGGRKEGLKLLESFLYYRSKNYSVEMSSPITAIESCSKLSAHISFGTLSIKEIFQMANNRIEIFRTPDGTRGNFSSIGTLEGLHWTFSQAGFLLSNDGNRIAVLWDTNGSGAAGISVYEYSAESWSKVGNDITGFSYPSSTENAYKNMSINHDGTIVGFVENQTGVVFIYKETNGTWSELLTPFNTNGTDTRSGATSLDFNSYGNVIAVVEDNCFDIQIRIFVFKFSFNFDEGIFVNFCFINFIEHFFSINNFCSTTITMINYNKFFNFV